MARKYPPCEVDFKALAKILEQTWGGARLPKMLFWNGRFTRPVIKQYRISLCTTCMNRLDDLKQTLPQNIKDNLNYPNIEFVLLDYNSKDGLGDWVKSEMRDYIERGTLVYYKTEEPEFFDMSHSRNIAFKVATGEIANNIDADAFTNKGFAECINRLANEQPEKAIFAKSRQLLRGRQGYFKKEFIELGGYDETLLGYGHDDADLMNRAWESGFKLMSFARCGDFTGIIPGHKKHQEGNYKEKWWITEGRNRFISYSNLLLGRFRANEGRIWGKAKLIKNFKEEIETGIYPKEV